MTERVYDTFILVYGKAPRCYVCGRRLQPGTEWRWFVPERYQLKAGTVRSLPVPAFGCAEGHEGEVIEVAGLLWRIAPEGRPPEEVKERATAYGA